jgi:predicted Zn-dependent protease
MQAEEQRLREKAAEAAPIDMGESWSVLSTHPATGERMKNLQEKWGRLDKRTYRTFDLNYAQFKDSLRAKLHAAEKARDQKDN